MTCHKCGGLLVSEWILEFIRTLNLGNASIVERLRRSDSQRLAVIERLQTVIRSDRSSA